MSDAHSQLIGSSAVMREIEDEVDCAARSDAKVLITGESGVGKEVIARMIHHRSARSRSPLVTINCAGVPDSLLESFGHVRGSFTDAYRAIVSRGLEETRGSYKLLVIGEAVQRFPPVVAFCSAKGRLQRRGYPRLRS